MKKFNIKNYTTEIPAKKSIAEIEEMLALFGAGAIMKEFRSDGTVHSLMFKINDRGYKLPANVNGVKEELFSGRRDYHGRDSMKKREEKAYRVAWRILKDWIHAQLSLILSGQSEPDKVLFPYIYDGQKTLYQAYKEGKFLLPKKKE